MLYKEAVSEKLLAALRELMDIPGLKDFRLVGGTALSLQLNHRESVDIDMFSYNTFSKEELKICLKDKFDTSSQVEVGERSLTFFMQDIKVDLYSMSHPFIRNVITEEQLRLAHVEDIAAMKLEAISQRAAKKDYYDIAELLSRYSFKQLLGFYEEKYPEYSIRNVLDVIKEIPRRNMELEKSPEPKTFRNIGWKDVMQIVFDAFDKFRYNELQAKIEEMKKRK
ncbi:MAG: nucleotidyl transferase AbiEii/AbiGii toxin family protein [Bacteroidota bacterium]